MIRHAQEGGSREILPISQSRIRLIRSGALIECDFPDASTSDGWKIPREADPSNTGYADTRHSSQLNDSVLNTNSNAQSRSALDIAKAVTSVDVVISWVLRIHRPACISTPIGLGKVTIADKHDPVVAAWWRARADEMHRVIDFGEEPDKAMSKGQPGSRGSFHAQIANMLAADLISSESTKVIARRRPIPQLVRSTASSRAPRWLRGRLPPPRSCNHRKDPSPLASMI